jgi:hypothetical protein
VAKFEKADEVIPICLIALNEPKSMQENQTRFDFGVCMAGWDGSKVYTAPGYRSDVERQCFTLCRADDQAQFNYSMCRYERMTAARYAGWQLSIPKAFAPLAKEHAIRQTHYWDRSDGSWRLKDFEANKQTLKPKNREGA